jgi:tRNA modification GTPase
VADSIYALGTPIGRSAVAVIRVSSSGFPKGFIEFLNIPVDKKGSWLRSLDLAGFSDQCLVLNFPGSNSYTGEHVVEIHCHGNPLIVSQLLLVLNELGLREAEKGEFTRRAFINNKMSLSDAESVMAGIRAGSVQELAALEDFRSGLLGKKLSDLTEKITEILATIESQLDFSDEEDVSDLSVDKSKEMICSLSASVESLLKNYQPYNAESKKKTVVLFGEPNVGKSSLFNALLGEGVAIVSSTPGTTRDVVRKRMFVDGVDVELEDTAGLRSQTSSEIEDMGIEMAKSAVEGADLVVYVFDNPEKVSNKTDGIVVLNKTDNHKSKVKDAYCVSAKTGEGIEDLSHAIGKAVRDDFDSDLVSERIYRGLSGVEALLKNSGIASDYYEQTSQNLRDSLVLLEEINGTFDNEDVLDQIFNKFCIGK